MSRREILDLGQARCQYYLALCHADCMGYGSGEQEMFEQKLKGIVNAYLSIVP